MSGPGDGGFISSHTQLEESRTRKLTNDTTDTENSTEEAEQLRALLEKGDLRQDLEHRDDCTGREASVPIRGSDFQYLVLTNSCSTDSGDCAVTPSATASQLPDALEWQRTCSAEDEDIDAVAGSTDHAADLKQRDVEQEDVFGLRRRSRASAMSLGGHQFIVNTALGALTG